MFTLKNNCNEKVNTIKSETGVHSEPLLGLPTDRRSHIYSYQAKFEVSFSFAFVAVSKLKVHFNVKFSRPL